MGGIFYHSHCLELWRSGDNKKQSDLGLVVLLSFNESLSFLALVWIASTAYSWDTSGLNRKLMAHNKKSILDFAGERKLGMERYFTHMAKSITN